VKRIKVILATVAAVALMLLAASPALASGWEGTAWEQWEDSDWLCSALWFHDDQDEWHFEELVCFNTETKDLWSWPS
jgi:hypothetical protein